MSNIKRKIKARLEDFAKSNVFFRGMFRQILRSSTRLKYMSYQLRYKLDDKTVLFETFGGRSYACSPKAIYEKMLTMPEFKDYTFVWSFNDVEAHNIKKD